MKQCPSITANGLRCSRLIKDSESYCYAHDPVRAAERKAHASNAAKAKNSQSELVSVRQRLRELGEDVLAGKVDKSKASITAQVWGVFLKAVEQERKQKEVQEFEERLAKLESM